jgi:predicted nucleic acid-binding protein
MAGLILDSDALVALMNINDIHHKSIVKRLFQSPEGFSISVVTYSEALVHSFDTGKEDLMVERIDSLVTDIFDVSASVARKAAQLRSTSKIKLPDALIAATAIEKGLTLLTFDEKLAKKVPGAELLLS